MAPGLDDPLYVVWSVRRAFTGTPARAVTIAIDAPHLRLRAYVDDDSDEARHALDVAEGEVYADFVELPRITTEVVRGAPDLFEAPFVVTGPIAWALAGTPAPRREAIARRVLGLAIEPPFAGIQATKRFLVEVIARASVPSLGDDGVEPLRIRHQDIHVSHTTFGWVRPHTQGVIAHEVAWISGYGLPDDPARAAAVVRAVWSIATDAAADEGASYEDGTCRHCGQTVGALDFDRAAGACHVCMAARGVVF